MATGHDLVTKFFDAYARRDMNAIKQVMHENVTWTFPGNHKLAGIKKGIDEVVDFFDAVGAIISASKPAVEKLVTGENERYIVECQQIKTNREDVNINQQACVLWTFENGKIKSGKHFFEDIESINAFYNALVPTSQSQIP
jgi:ketosteroid isomerase-like protein